MKEWHRTIILLALLVLAAGFIFWMNNSYDTNFVDTLR